MTTIITPDSESSRQDLIDAFWDRKHATYTGIHILAKTDAGRLTVSPYGPTAHLDAADDLYVIERDYHTPGCLWRTNPLGGAERGYTDSGETINTPDGTYRRWTPST